MSNLRSPPMRAQKTTCPRRRRRARRERSLYSRKYSAGGGVMGTTTTTKTWDEFGKVTTERFQEDGSPTPGGTESHYTRTRPDLAPPPKDARPLDDWRRFKWVRLA